MSSVWNACFVIFRGGVNPSYYKSRLFTHAAAAWISTRFVLPTPTQSHSPGAIDNRPQVACFALKTALCGTGKHAVLWYDARPHGEVAEWSKAHAWKVCNG